MYALGLGASHIFGIYVISHGIDDLIGERMGGCGCVMRVQ